MGGPVSDKNVWKDMARKELKGGEPDSLTWATLEGIAVKPLYTAEDTAGLAHLGGVPGVAPCGRTSGGEQAPKRGAPQGRLQQGTR